VVRVEWVTGRSRCRPALCPMLTCPLRMCPLRQYTCTRVCTCLRAGAHASVPVPTSCLPASHGQAGGRRKPRAAISVDAWIAAQARKNAITKEKEARRAARAVAKLQRERVARQKLAARVAAALARKAAARAAKEAQTQQQAKRKAKRNETWIQRANQRLSLAVKREARKCTTAQSRTKSGCVAVGASGVLRIDLAALTAKRAAESRVVRVRLHGAGVVKRTQRRIAVVTLKLCGAHPLRARC